jgi:hypothetical protein
MTLFKRRPRPYARPTVKAIASRAIFAEAQGYLPKIHMTFELENGEQIAFELEIDEAGKFIEQSISAYRAIVPQLRTGMGGWGS